MKTDRPASEPSSESPSDGRDAAIQQRLLTKLRLLPLCERELSTLRQAHQHQRRWIEGAQELMVRLTNASAIPEALDALVKSLVQEFGFDISGASTEENLLAGDPVEQLTQADRAFLENVVRQVKQSRDLVISDGEGIEGERTLAWLMAGLASTSDMGADPVVIVGRTRRTAPYYPVPKAQEVGLYRHLLSTVAQVFRSIALQANHNAQLERKVIERTAALHEAQRRVVALEKEKIAEQMAGGFAHEMRNALSGAKILIEKGMGAGRQGGQSVIDSTASELKRLFVVVRDRLDASEAAQFRNSLQEIARNERTLDNVLKSVDCSVQRALSITALIMEYSRVGCSQRGSALVDVAALAQSIITESSATFAEQGVVAVADAEGTCFLRGNEAHVHSILKNLVVNAFDALCEVGDGRPRRIVVQSRGLADRLVCRVTDNANGIPLELRTRIYEPFFSTKPQTGTGLGLGMVLKLVALHDGTLDLETEVGCGTTFSLSFPIGASDSAPESRGPMMDTRSEGTNERQGDRVAGRS